MLVYPALEPGVASDFKMNSTTFGREWEGLKRVDFSAVDGTTGEVFNGGVVIDEIVYAVR